MVCMNACALVVHGLHEGSREPARQNFRMACGMKFDKSILKHAENVACKRAHPFAAWSAEQAAARLGSGHPEAVCELYMHARRMACCMHIADSMKDAVHMLSMHHSMHRGLLRKSLCARACRRGVVLMNNGVF